MAYTSENYINNSAEVNIKRRSKEDITQNMALEPIVEGKKLEYGDVKFATGTANLTEDSYAVLDKVLEFLNTYPDVMIVIGGHTDNSGDDKDNMKLSQDRAAACADYLISKGITEDRFMMRGFGERRPLVPNTSVRNKAKNRRVEFEVIE